MSGAAPRASSALRGRRILVVEDEYMIAQEIAEMLAAAGAEALGPVPSVSDAIQLIASEGWIDGALLDVNLNNEAVWPVADALRARDVPVVLATGYDANVIPPAYAHLPRCEKPATGQDLARALARALRTQDEPE
jgi:CheY-like chemotaxis protein